MFLVCYFMATPLIFFIITIIISHGWVKTFKSKEYYWIQRSAAEYILDLH